MVFEVRGLVNWLSSLPYFDGVKITIYMLKTDYTVWPMDFIISIKELQNC